MSDFIPVHEQRPVALPDEEPVVDVRLDTATDAPERYNIRHDLCKKLGEAAIADKVGGKIPEDVRERFGLVLAELVSNADRPERGRHITHALVWAGEGRIEVGVGDDLPGFVDDKREEDPFEEHGFGGDLLEVLADDVRYSVVDHRQVGDDHTKKIVRALLKIPKPADSPEHKAA